MRTIARRSGRSKWSCDVLRGQFKRGRAAPDEARFARDKYDHFALRSFLTSLGISLRSATERIDDTSTGKVMEGVLASFAQFDNYVRSDRTRAGMKAALELGRWTFLAPLGYINVPRTYGKSLIPDPERASIVQQIFRDFSSGRLAKQELLDDMTRRGLRTRRGLPVSSPGVQHNALQQAVHRDHLMCPGTGSSESGEISIR